MGDVSVENQVEQWGLFELALSGPADGNPFRDVELSGEFSYRNRSVEVRGFYDGGGTFRLRFMPDSVGPWRYVTRSNCRDLDGASGELTCTPPAAGNHGPVRVRNTYHFAYEDSTAYVPVGTTCYVWNHQGDELEARTLRTLRDAPFNKLRMCVFPKDYEFSRNEPPHHPFEGSLEGGWDFSRFNPAFFSHLEGRVGDLLAMGIEADVILFHPYDRWGYAEMPADVDDAYLRYVVARLAAWRNVWWSFANEYDLMAAKTTADWDRFFRIVQEEDPAGHLRSIHNCRGFYDHARPWVTHCSVQHSDLSRVGEWRRLYGKPVVVDECCYEGNIHHGWGNISAGEMVHRFWAGTVRGGYVGHGETYLHPEDILWWSKGGVLHGQSPPRIAFLREVLQDAPPGGLDPIDFGWDTPCAGRAGEYYLVYFGIKQPAFKELRLPAGGEFRVEIIDTWEMTVTPAPGTYRGACRVDLPAKPHVALRIRRAR